MTACHDVPDPREASWEALRETLDGYEVALFLGAGTSTANAMPGWTDLAADLGGWSRERVARLRHGGIPLTTLFGIARAQAEEQAEAWPERVRSGLYAGFLAQMKGKAAEIPGLSFDDLGSRDSGARDRVSKFFRATNPVLFEIVRICGGAKANDHVGAVLTTNIDGLIQLCDRALHPTGRKLRTIERASTEGEVGKIPLYHLHGYLLPRRAGPRREAEDRMVLTEAEYLDRNDDPYSWANVMLHMALREFPVIFIGCSMTDELIRRALHRTHRERLVDYEAKYGRRRAGDRALRNFAVTLLEAGDPEGNEFRRRSLAELGVRPLWVTDFETDLPRRLGDLREIQERAR